MAAAIDMSAPRAFREDLLRIDPPALLGSNCPQCGLKSFPPRDFCPACGAEDGLEAAPLATRGHIFSFTIVRQAPPGRATPYVLAYVDLADEVRVMSQILCAPEEIKIGLPVELTLRPFDGGGGDGALVYCFRPTGATQEIAK